MKGNGSGSPNSMNGRKVAFLAGRESADTCAAIRHIAELEGVQIVAVLVDTAQPTSRRKNLARNIRREGPSYLFFRALSLLREALEQLSTRVIPDSEVEQLLDVAFPDRGLDRLAKQCSFPVFRVGNLNGAEAIGRLSGSGAELGIVLGTRILKRPIFSIPRLGCINLHKGKVPEYRGTPPGFWELYEGASSAGVTVHFVDEGLDTGDVVGTSEVAVHPKETPESLKAKLDAAGIQLLRSVVEQIRDGSIVRQKQNYEGRKPRTRPTRLEVNELARRLPHWRRLSDGRQVLKMMSWLAIYHSGIFRLLRWSRRNQSRGAILLYHRVNDISQDVLTTSPRRFAEHLITLRHFYRPVPTEELLDRITAKERIESTSVAVHFDDCYRDVRSLAAPLLQAATIPGTAFVSSGFVDTGRTFLHDRDKSPHRFENMSSQDLRTLPALGVNVAAHTVNHVDLGKVTLEDAHYEVVESRNQLEKLTHRPVLLFSFPFGRPHNIREQVRKMVMQAGYRALFSAYGGFIDRHTSVLDVPRFGVSSDQTPLALLMELEGISLAHLQYRMRQEEN
jgi:peptidoglycan/xylan/chitin deacetylase (PgdA/CDA1 family)